MESSVAFRRIGFGIIFIFLNFTINGFDIIPNVVGYILFAIAINELADKSEYFRKVEPLNWVALVLSVIFIFPVQNIFQSTIIGNGISLATGILNALVIYLLLSGAVDMAMKKGESELAAVGEQRRDLYIVYFIVGCFAYLMIFLPFLLYIYFGAYLIFSIVMTILMCTFFFSCDEQLSLKWEQSDK